MAMSGAGLRIVWQTQRVAPVVDPKQVPGKRTCEQDYNTTLGIPCRDLAQIIERQALAQLIERRALAQIIER